MTYDYLWNAVIFINPPWPPFYKGGNGCDCSSKLTYFPGLDYLILSNNKVLPFNKRGDRGDFFFLFNR